MSSESFRSALVFPQTVHRVINGIARPDEANPRHQHAPLSSSQKQRNLHTLRGDLAKTNWIRHECTVITALDRRKILGMSDHLGYDRLKQALDETIRSVQNMGIAREDVLINDEIELGEGGYGSVWVATLRNANSGTTSQVAVKILRPPGNRKSRLHIAVALARELRVWSTLHHPNVLPFVGFRLAEDYSEAWLLSPIQKNGNVRQYFKRIQPGILPRVEAVIEMTAGLAYLHGLSPPVCHGDLKPDNLLVDDSGHILLCDFGLTVVPDTDPTGLTTTTSLKGTVRYLAPELLEMETPVRTLRSDVWAWGCVVIELLTDRMPYAELSGDYKVIQAIMEGNSPSFPPDMPLASIIGQACQIVPSARPDIQQCLGALTAEAAVLGGQNQGLQLEDTARSMFSISTPRAQNGSLTASYSHFGDLPPGDYTIKNTYSEGAMDLADGKAAPGTPILNFGLHGGLNQTWTFEPGRRGYTIKNGFGPYVSFGPGVKVVDGAAISGNPTGVEWQVRRHDSNYMIMLASDPSLVLDISEATGAEAPRIVVRQKSGTLRQDWTIETAKGAPTGELYTKSLPTGVTFKVRNTYSRKALDLTDGSSDPGTAITSRTVTGDKNQSWILEAGKYGYYIKNAASNSYVGFAEGVPSAPGSPISGNPTPVEWIIINENNLLFIRLAADPNLVLDLPGWSNRDGTQIALWNKNGGENQAWIFELTPSS